MNEEEDEDKDGDCDIPTGSIPTRAVSVVQVVHEIIESTRLVVHRQARFN
jgi:hypothetical protein